MLWRPSPQVRAATALMTLQRNSFALEMLRTKLESEIRQIKSGPGKDGEGYEELADALGLVREGEQIISELSGRIEAGQMLDEFITVIDSATLSLNKIRKDIERLVPSAEAALKDLSEQFAKLSLDDAQDMWVCHHSEKKAEPPLDGKASEAEDENGGQLAG